MPDVFISYSTQDKEVADFVYRHLKAEGINVFMAAQSLQPGQEWTEAIKQALRGSKTVVVLASKAAMQSSAVMFEAGAAFFGEGKRIWPVIWDMEPRELPEWLRRYQALDLRTLPNGNAFAGQLKQLASQINMDKLIGLGIVGALIWAFAKFGKS